MVKKSKDKSKPTLFEHSRSTIHNNAAPTLPADDPNESFPRASAPAKSVPEPTLEAATAMRFSSPIAMRVPQGLQASPSWFAQQTLKRNREAENENTRSSMIAESEYDKLLESDNNGEAEAVTESEESEDGSSSGRDGVKSVHGERDVEILKGIHEAAEGKQEDEDDQEMAVDGAYSSDSSPGSSAASSSQSSADSSTSSSSSEGENGDDHATANQDTESETEVEIEESPLKRLKRKHPNLFGDEGAAFKPKTSVATRNPPPPELEGQFKYSNSIIGNNIYRYPKPVLHAVGELEKITPRSVLEYVKNNPEEKNGLQSEFIEKHGEGNEDTKRVIVALESARHLIVHLGKARVFADGKWFREGMADELMRIAVDRGEEVENLRAQMDGLKRQVGEMRGKEKKKRS